MTDQDFEIGIDPNGHIWVKLSENQTLFYNRDKDSYSVDVVNSDGSTTTVVIPAYVLDLIYNKYWEALKPEH